MGECPAPGILGKTEEFAVQYHGIPKTVILRRRERTRYGKLMCTRARSTDGITCTQRVYAHSQVYSLSVFQCWHTSFYFIFIIFAAKMMHRRTTCNVSWATNLLSDFFLEICNSCTRIRGRRIPEVFHQDDIGSWSANHPCFFMQRRRALCQE